MLTIGKNKIEPIDLLSERFLFGHRIEIGKLVEPGSEFNLIEGVISILYEIEIQPYQYSLVYKHVEEVIEKLKIWIEKEMKLEYTPTSEEQQAGIHELSEKIKEFGTIDAIATRMHISHDDALKLPYSTVFMMLLKDLEQSKFERRLHKVYENKYKK